MSKEIIIDSQKDLDNHFEWHDIEKEKLQEEKMNFLSLCNEYLTDQQKEKYNEYDKKIDELEKDHYHFNFNDKSISMDSCCGGCWALDYVKFCPFCGIKFTIKERLE